LTEEGREAGLGHRLPGDAGPQAHSAFPPLPNPQQRHTTSHRSWIEAKKDSGIGRYKTRCSLAGRCQLGTSIYPNAPATIH
jgi:hypothetical protein